MALYFFGMGRLFHKVNIWMCGGGIMDEFISVISNVGFPIFIAMFLLIRVENKIDTLVSTFIDLTDSIDRLVEQSKEK